MERLVGHWGSRGYIEPEIKKVTTENLLTSPDTRKPLLAREEGGRAKSSERLKGN